MIFSKIRRQKYLFDLRIRCSTFECLIRNQRKISRRMMYIIYSISYKKYDYMIHIEFANIPYISYIFTPTEIRIRGKTKLEKEQKVSLHNVQTRQGEKPYLSRASCYAKNRNQSF